MSFQISKVFVYLYSKPRAARRSVPPGEAGQVLALTALLLPALLGLAGLAIDVGVARAQQRRAQVAADAAAMAGADDLPCNSCGAVADATAFATDNGFTNGVGGVTVIVNWPPVNATTCPTSHAGDANSVQVCISENVPTFLLGVMHQNTITVRAHATATSAASTSPPCALCVLDPDKSGALINNGNPTVTVVNGGIVVDSTSSTAGIFNGNPSVTAGKIGIVGNYNANGNVSLSPTPATGVNPVPDPLAGVPTPAISGPNQGTALLNGNGSVTINPGIYTGITLNGNGTMKLNAGLYVITGPVTINGNPNIVGQGVTLYFTCSGYSSANPAPCQGSPGSGLTLNGNPTYDLTAPSSGSYKGLAVFYDRGNTAPLVLNGNASDTFTGTIYAKSAPATLNGNPGVNQLNSLIVVDTATLNGNGQLKLVFDQNQNYAVPPATGSSNLSE